MIRLAFLVIVANFPLASSFAFVPTSVQSTQRPASQTRPLLPPLAAKPNRSRHGSGNDGGRSLIDRALEFFQDGASHEAKEKGSETAFERHRAAANAALGIQDDTKTKKGETAFDRHRAAAKAALGMQDDVKSNRSETAFDKHRAAARAALESASDAIASAAGGVAAKDGGGRVDVDGDIDVDAGLLNRLLVHAEKILTDDRGVAKLLGGPPIAAGRVLSRSACPVVVDGGRKTDGIRAFVEVRGPQRSGMALVVGDRRGVLLLKLTVGGRTLDVKIEDGLDLGVVHGVKRLRQ